MQMKLISLHIENFKSIRDFTLQADGENISIYGENEAGKTSTYDAFLWLLFGRNSLGDSKFGIKPNGAPDGIEPSATALFSVDDKPMELKKTLAAKYTKETGEYKESKTECFINGVKKAVREYENQVAELINENTFKLLTNPRYFNEMIDWKERRSILFTICQTHSESDIIEANSEYTELADKLDQYGSIDEHRAYLLTQRKQNSEAINKIPTRIDEVFRQIDTTTDFSAEQKLLSEKNEEMQDLRSKLAKLEGGNAVTSVQGEIVTLEQQKMKIEADNRNHIAEQEKLAQQHLQKITDGMTDQLNRKRELLATARAEQAKCNTDVAQLSSERQKLLLEYKRIQDQEWTGDTICPTCGKDIDKSEVEKSRGNFNEAKIKNLDINKSAGIEVKNLLAIKRQDQIEATDSVQKLEKEIKDIEASKLAVSSAEFETTNLPTYEQDVALIQAEIAQKQAELSGVKESTEPQKQAVKEQIHKLNIEIQERTAVVARGNNNEELQKRLSELKVEQKNLAAQQGEVLRLLNLSDRFIRRKIDLVEDSINANFKLTKFKLFEENVTNDGVRECCEAIAFNAPNYKDINNAGKILTGIDIINTLSKHYGYNVPLWIDNCEGITKDINADMQLIKLIASKQDKTLRVERG